VQGQAFARAAAESLALHAPPVGPDDATRQRLEVLRVATETRHKLKLVYLDLQQRSSERTVHPLGCFFWGQVWTLAAWCETREAFRSFRVDRIRQVELLDERFRDEPGRTLADLLREVQGAA
jgi:predicted DNA-binding transcriptional regulator YafY